MIKKQKFIRVIHQMAFLYPRLTIRKHTYYIRVAVPKRLINIVKKRNIVYSLQTKDYQEALYRVRESFEIMGILYECLNKGCQVWTTKEKYKLGDDLNSQILAFAFSISASIEKSLISARTKETLARLKNSGVKLGRPQGSKNKNLKLAGKEKEIKELLAQGVSKAKISKIYGVNRISLYHFIKNHLNKEP